VKIDKRKGAEIQKGPRRLIGEEKREKRRGGRSPLRGRTTKKEKKIKKVSPGVEFEVWKDGPEPLHKKKEREKEGLLNLHRTLVSEQKPAQPERTLNKPATHLA